MTTTVYITEDADPHGGYFALHFIEPDPQHLHQPVEIRRAEVTQEFLDSLADGTLPFDPRTRLDAALAPLFEQGESVWLSD